MSVWHRLFKAEPRIVAEHAPLLLWISKASRSWKWKRSLSCEVNRVKRLVLSASFNLGTCSAECSKLVRLTIPAHYHNTVEACVSIEHNWSLHHLAQTIWQHSNLSLERYRERTRERRDMKKIAKKCLKKVSTLLMSAVSVSLPMDSCWFIGIHQDP